MLSGAANFLWPLSAMTHVVSRSKRIILLTKPECQQDMTELHENAANGDEDAVQELLYRGSNVNEKDLEWGGRTPLHWAATNGHYYVVELLINSGGSVNARMNNGWTPLHCAAEAGHKRITQLLLGSGCNPFASDRYGDTAFNVAKIYQQDAVLKELEKYLNQAQDETLEEEERKLEQQELVTLQQQDFEFVKENKN